MPLLPPVEGRGLAVRREEWFPLLFGLHQPWSSGLAFMNCWLGRLKRDERLLTDLRSSFAPTRWQGCAGRCVVRSVSVYYLSTSTFFHALARAELSWPWRPWHSLAAEPFDELE